MQGDASSARREEGAYRAYVTDEQRSDATWIPAFPPESNLFGALASASSPGPASGLAVTNDLAWAAPRRDAAAHEFDLRWRGVALSDLPGTEAATLAEAVRLANPGHLTTVDSITWLERSLTPEGGATMTSTTDLEASPRHLIQIVGRHPRFATDADPRSAKKPPLGVVVVRAIFPSDRSDMPEFRIVREAPIASLDLEIKASLLDRLTLVSDESFGFARIYPVGVGALDTVRVPGEMSSLTPATELGRVSRDSGFLSLSAPSWNRGLPYLPFEIPWVANRPDGQRRWYVQTRIAFHAFQGQTFSRGFNSHGCITLRDNDLKELAALVFARPVPVPLIVRPNPFAEHQHPFPHETTHFWELENLGTTEHPHITRGNLYAIKKVREAPPVVAEMVGVFMTGEKHGDLLGPVVAYQTRAPASLVP